MKNVNIKIASLIFVLSLVSIFSIPDADAQNYEQIIEDYSEELEKIQQKRDAEDFFWTHVKDEFGMTENVLNFINDLRGGTYVRQIEYIQNVPVQKWNPNAGYGGWGRYDRGNVQRIVSKNVGGTTALNNVFGIVGKISWGLKIYGLGSDIIKALNGDDKAKLNSIKTTFDIVLGMVTSDFPGMTAAMFGVAVINYNLNKFINTTISTYEDLWWEEYQNYLFRKYPSFVEDWAHLAVQEGGQDIIEDRLYEFWDSEERYFIQDQHWQLPFHRYGFNAERQLHDMFAARYYQDYLHRNMKARVRTITNTERDNVALTIDDEAEKLKEIISELKILQELIELAEREMNQQSPASISISAEKTTVEVGESINFTAIAVFEDESSTNITDLEETNWSMGSHTFTADQVGESEISVTFRGVTATTTVTVVDRTPVSLTLSPSQATLEIGETEAFTALAIYEDGTSQDITQLGSTEWNIGSNTFTAQEPGEEVITASYRGLSAQATVTTVEGDGQSCTDENATWNADRQQCICNDGYEPNAELGKCISLDEALDEIAEEDEGALCDETELAEKLVRLNELAASGNRMAANFQSMFRKFLKEINDQNSNPCTNSLVAYTYASAKEIHTEYQAMADEATEISTDLMLEGALCPLEELELDVTRILQTVSEVGRPIGQIEDGIATMENELLTYGCDEQDVSDLGDTIADRSTNPEVIESGGVGTMGVVNPGVPGGPGGGVGSGTSGGITAGYADGPLSSINVTVNINSRSFNFALSRGGEDLQRFENERIQEGDRVQINVSGTGLNPAITLRESDFSTIPGSDIRLFGMIILVVFDDDEDQMRYRMSVLLTQGGRRCLVFPGGGSCQDF